MNKTNLLLAAILCFTLSSIKAQYYKNKTGFASTVNTFSYIAPSANFIDTLGNLKYKQIGAGAILPLYGKIIIKEKDASPQLFQIFLNSGFTVGYPEINFKYTLRPRTLYDASAGLTSLYYFGNNNTLLAGAYSFLSEDQITINQSEPRFGGFFLYNHYNTKHKISYKIGTFYSYLFGKGLPLPIIGLTKEFSEKALLTIILPLQISYTYKSDNKHQYTLFIKPRGYINNFSNQLQDIQFNDGKIPTIQARRTNIKVGIEEKLQLHPNCLLKAEIGILTARNLAFFYQASNSNNSLFTTNIKTAGYFQIMLSYKINKKQQNPDKQMQKQTTHPSFIDFSNFDLDNLDLNDLHFENIKLENININDIDINDIDIEDIIEQIE